MACDIIDVKTVKKFSCRLTYFLKKSYSKDLDFDKCPSLISVAFLYKQDGYKNRKA